MYFPPTNTGKDVLPVVGSNIATLHTVCFYLSPPGYNPNGRRPVPPGVKWLVCEHLKMVKRQVEKKDIQVNENPRFRNNIPIEFGLRHILKMYWADP